MLSFFSMSAPVTVLEFVKIGIDCHTEVAELTNKPKNSGIIKYIEKEGKAQSKRIQKYLEAAKPHLVKMNSLVAKGQIFGIENYHNCQNACYMLTWSYNQIESFSYFIGNSNLYWSNPKIQEHLENMLKINHEDIKNNLTEQDEKYIAFANGEYAKIFNLKKPCLKK